MKRLPLLGLLFCSLLLSGKPRFRVVTWNVENLFDCRHDTLKEDKEFLPEGVRRWTRERYAQKLADVGRTLMSIGGDEPVALIGLCEVENDSVMQSLTNQSMLRGQYQYVMTDSPDRRGIDVALMYTSDFQLLGNESKRVPSEAHGLPHTRDLLHAWGRLPSGDTLHVVVCHLPSRAGNKQTSKQNRALALQTLDRLVDSLASHIPDCQLMIMGDFNSTLRELKGMKSLWRGKPEEIPSANMLIPLTPDNRYPTSGTYRFQGNWSWIDHIMVTPSLYNKVSKAKLHTQPWMQRPLADGTWYPRRTYLGTTYNGGVSDHVPVYCDVYW